MNKPLALEMEHLSPQGPWLGEQRGGAPLPGTGFLFLGPEDVANLSCGTEE